jgi:L-ascorbate metabolism protein UlaG (beta-lactamase superfamily)
MRRRRQVNRTLYISLEAVLDIGAMPPAMIALISRKGDRLGRLAGGRASIMGGASGWYEITMTRLQNHAPEGRSRRQGWFRRLVGWTLRLTGAGLLIAVSLTLGFGWTAFGKHAEGSRRARMAASPQWRDKQFVNPQPIVNNAGNTLRGMWHGSPYASPTAPLPVVRGDAARFETPPPTGLRVTWMGHSTTLVEIDGHRLLTDPVWSERVSPLPGVGPRAWYAPPLALDELPAIDAVLISHDHYDHLDQRTIVALARMKDGKTIFIVPLGIGAHLAYWGIPEARIVELDWWQQTRIGDLEIVSTPARHASGRMVVDTDAKLWGGWALLGARHRVYYSGDTGLFPALREIGARLGPFDLTLIECGQYGSGWPDWHLGPEQAVRAHQLVRGRVMLPVHWGKLVLAFHGWTEPIERVLVAAAKAGVSVLAPRPGQSVEPEAPPARERWWPNVPWKTGEEDPIVASQVDAEIKGTTQ